MERDETFKRREVCSGDLLNHINVKEVENLSTHELANSINKAFLEPLEVRVSSVLPHHLPGTGKKSP